MSVEVTSRGPISSSTKFGPLAGIQAGQGASAVAATGPVKSDAAPSYLGDLDSVSPLTVLIGFGLLLALLKIVGEGTKAAGIEPSHMHIGGYNLLTVTATAVLGIALLKLFANRWHVPGLTPLVNFI